MVRRRAGAAALALVLAVVQLPPAVADGAAGWPAGLVDLVCGLPRSQAIRIARGVHLPLTGDVQLLPRPPDFVSGGLSHAGPWSYVQDVPLLLYGPGLVRPGRYGRAVTLADIASTEGAMLGFPFHTPDGRALTDALVPGARPPRLLLTLVWDSAGLDVLHTWPDEWPYMRSLVPKGAWFEHATAGASPSNTPPSHAIMGTGAFPERNGIGDDWSRFGSSIVKPYDIGPGALLLPTLADLYDRSMDNRPLVGIVATLDAHVGMMSHGSAWGGGDRDIAVTRQDEDAVTAGAEADRWQLSEAMRSFYRLPSYVNGIGGFGDDLHLLDQADGALDGRWRSNSISQLSGGFDTPARTPLQTRIVEEIVRREGFGVDDVPDLLDVNYKAMDTIGHLFSLNSPEMKDALAWQDDALRELVDFLDREVGKGRWAMVLTADHGHQYSPSVSGAFEIDIDSIQRAVNDRFDDGDGTPVVQWIRPTEIWIDREELADAGATLVDVSSFVMTLTKGSLVKRGQSADPAQVGQRAFEAAFPSAMLAQLPCLRGAA